MVRRKFTKSLPQIYAVLAIALFIRPFSTKISGLPNTFLLERQYTQSMH